jgi:hypothetical protein
VEIINFWERLNQALLDVYQVWESLRQGLALYNQLTGKGKHYA